MTAPTAIRIDVFSDTVCPWCWIGKRRLEQALTRRPDLRATVVWHAFQLNPDMPEDGMDRREYLETKFGGPERARSVYEKVGEEGRKEDLPFAFDRIPRTPNTLESHRLVRWAASQPAGQEPMVEALFRAYFADGRDLSDIDTLVQVAVAAGYDGPSVRGFLASADERGAVWAEDQRARNAGITGVPCFVLDGRVAVPGAVEPDVMLKIFDEYGIGAAPAHDGDAAPPAG